MKLAARARSGLDRLSVGTKLVASFAAVLLLTAALGGVSYLALSRVYRTSDELASKWMPAVGHLTNARSALLELRDLELRHAHATDASYRGEYEEKMTADAALVSSHLDAVRRQAAAGDESKLSGALVKGWTDYLAMNRKVVALGNAGKQEDAQDIGDGASKMALDDGLTALDAMTAFDFKSGAADAERASATFKAAKVGVLALVAGSLCLGTCMALLLTRSLLRQLGGEPRAAMEVVRGIAEGDLTRRIRVAAGDSGSLMACLREMQASLSDVVGKVREGSEGVAKPQPCKK